MRDKDNQHSRLYYIILTIVIIAICVVVVILFNTLKTNRSHSTDRYADFTELKKDTIKIKIGVLKQNTVKIRIF